jgi:hypothetical protein
MIHDHYDGSAHCVECGGPCRLVGSELALTRVVRAIFEQFDRETLESIYYDPPRPVFGFLRDMLIEAGVDVRKHAARAEKTKSKVFWEP